MAVRREDLDGLGYELGIDMPSTIDEDFLNGNNVSTLKEMIKYLRRLPHLSPQSLAKLSSLSGRKQQLISRILSVVSSGSAEPRRQSQSYNHSHSHSHSHSRSNSHSIQRTSGPGSYQYPPSTTSRGWENSLLGVPKPHTERPTSHPSISILLQSTQYLASASRSPDFHYEKTLRACFFTNGSAAAEFNVSTDDLIRERKLVQLRLFDPVKKVFVRMQQNDQIYVNRRAFSHDSKQKTVGFKKTAHHIVKPVDVTSSMQPDKNQIQVELDPFRSNGSTLLLCVELVKKLPVQELVQKVKVRSLVLPRNSSSPPVTSMRRCGYCSATDDLMRCSRCKAQWYCSREHQQVHWNVHRLTCFPRDNVDPEVTKPKDDDVEAMEVKVSLCCPLSIERIRLPAKGKACTHPQCFELEAFLTFCIQTNAWQCPICAKSLPFEDVVVDKHMSEILSIAQPNVTQVRLEEDGSFTVMEEAHESDSEDDLHEPVNKKARTGSFDAQGAPDTLSAAPVPQNEAPVFNLLLDEDDTNLFDLPLDQSASLPAPAPMPPVQEPPRTSGPVRTCETSPSAHSRVLA